ncbi:hypothetical protein GL263_04175 [Streptomyces durbertensis]|uniref:Integral membrane protein n=1 Tax=Streptomyces durbertensis TaxID=2448886 RepID=A0ABR6EC81_9ACTN|nr:hypothetical protein [Streptomyces durbertensis]MBB1242773.1 hypothetical protein [Streptomyces durbertensis]
MAQAVRERGFRSQLGNILNSDGKPHPVENAWVAAAVVVGLVAFVAGFFPGLHLLASWAGLLGILAAAWGQMISATTAERFLLIISLGAAAVGFYLGMANGGLFGGILG